MKDIWTWNSGRRLD